MKKISILSLLLSLTFTSIIIAAETSTQFTYTTNKGVTYKTTHCNDTLSNTRVSRQEKHTLLAIGLTKIESFILIFDNKGLVQHQRTIEFAEPKPFSLFNNVHFSLPSESPVPIQNKSPIPSTHRAIVAKVLKGIEHTKIDQ